MITGRPSPCRDGGSNRVRELDRSRDQRIDVPLTSPSIPFTGSMASMSASLNPAESTVLVESFDVLLLDLDGVIYIGRSPVPHAAVALEECARDSGTRFVYVTNNASRTPQDVAHVLAAVGVRAESEDIVTSAQVAANRLAQIVERGSSVLVVGGDGLDVALRDVGLVPVRRLDDEPVAVVQGFHPDIGWRDLAQAAGALHKGLPWIASNADLTLPTELGIAPGNGALIAALSTAVARYPEVVGKPFAPPIVEAVRRTEATSPLIVGDRLDTDIEAAHAAGFQSLLVFTGVSDVLTFVRRQPSIARATCAWTCAD